MTMNITLVNFIDKHRKLIIAGWLIFTLSMIIFFAPNFFNSTRDEFEPPDGSDAAMGIELQERYFPDRVNDASHLVVVHSDNSVNTTDFATFTQQLMIWSQDHYGQYLVSAVGYFIFEGDPALDSFKYNFMSADQTASFIGLTFNAELEIQETITEELLEFVASIEPDSLDAYITGFFELSKDTNESIEHDMARIDSIVIPLVFILLLILLGNWRYFPVTFTPIILTIGASFGLMERYIAVTDATVQSFVPSVLISLTLGIGVDYNLFLLTRFKEEKQKGLSNLEATQTMMKYAGHTVFTSGVTLIISMAGLAFFPISTLASVGVAISLGIFVLLAMNLTFTPALLLIWGDWLEKPVEQTTESTETKEAEQPKSFGRWYGVGKFASRNRIGVLSIILLLTLPLSFQLINTEPEAETQFFAPRGSESGKGFLLLQEHWGSGSIGPLNLYIVPESGDVWSFDTFSHIHDFVDQSIAKTGLAVESFSSHAYLGGQKVIPSIAESLLNPENMDPLAVVYRTIAPTYVSSDAGLEGAAAYISIIFPVDPYSPQARDYYHQMRDIAHEVFGEGYETGFVGQTVVGDSSIAGTYEVFPWMILLVVIAIYALVGIMFKAVILPARLIATIGLTMSFIYGAATVVFQYEWFINDIFPATAGTDVLFWMLPVMSFSIILGLGMDYDIFTIERIKENVWRGLNTEEAIAQGLDKTGRIITGAGLIMMISFGGMMFSSSYILVQFGFVLTFAVFLDTFVVRSLLVPAIMNLADQWNWWPNHPPINEDVGEVHSKSSSAVVGE